MGAGRAVRACAWACKAAVLPLSPLAVAAEAGGGVELMVHDRAQKRRGLLLPIETLCRWPMAH